MKLAMTDKRLWALLLLLCRMQPVRGRLSDYVDPLIGTEGSTPGSAIAGGNSFPGASLPWGMVKAGIDTSYLGVPNGTAVDCNAGFSPLGNVTAVSMMHVTGTGGTPTYGLISQMPLLGTLDGVNLADNNTYAQNRSFGAESASVGFFTTTLLNGVKIDVTAANHSALMRYTFPGNSSVVIDNTEAQKTNSDAHVLVDLTHVLPAYSSQSYGQRYLNGELHVRSGAEDNMPSYFGSATYTGGWAQADHHTVYFCGNFTVPGTSSLVPTSLYVQPKGRDMVEGAGTFNWQYDHFHPPASKPTVQSYTNVKSSAGNYMGVGALFSWTPEASPGGNESVIEARLGISYINSERACNYVASELPAGLSFEEVVEQAQVEWETKVLNKIEVLDDRSATSGNDTLKRMLYTAMYQTGLQPTDKTGENPYWTSNESLPYYDDHYTIWDTYRTLLPMYHLLFTPVYSRVVKGLINIFTFEGFLPAGRITNWNGRVQGGSHADIVLADAYVKSEGACLPSANNNTCTTGARELAGIDWEEAYRAMIKDATELPVHNIDSVANDGATKEGRGALDDYLQLKYITRNHTRSISRGLEYSQDDFTIWSVATGLNKSSVEQETYLDRASWWQNQWNPSANTTLEGLGSFSGFPAPRNLDGSFNHTQYDPIQCLPSCSWGDDIYEAKVWETSFSAAPHDMARVISLMGGDAAFVERLDASFLPGFGAGSSVGDNNAAGTALFNPGNEPSFALPFLYNYVPGHHWKTANQSRATVDAFYGVGKDGYPGNIDSGALPSWLIFNLLGLYPVAGQPVYLLGAPRFSGVRMTLFGGTAVEKNLTIRAEGLADDSYYPQSVLLDGKSLDRSWLTHAELLEAEEIVFSMGKEPARWDVGERPWSLSEWV